jgi:putative flippase GtrA
MSRRGLLQLLRFCVVGASNTLITLLVYVGSTALGTPAPAAAALGFAVGAANGYLLNRAWTFRAPGAVGRYVLVQALGAGASALGIGLATGAIDAGRLVAEGMVVPPVTLLTYVLSRRFVFGAGPAGA